VENETVLESAGPHWTFSVIHAAHLIEDRIEEALGKVGLSIAKQGALSELAAAGEPLTLSQLAARLSCVRSNMTQLVDRLEADGLVKRLDDPADRRSVRAELTALGKEKQRAGEKAMKRVQGEFAASLTSRERSALEAALGALK
jgi:DNA-binding MarR family transcriptional regulator